MGVVLNDTREFMFELDWTSLKLSTVNVPQGSLSVYDSVTLGHEDLHHNKASPLMGVDRSLL